MLLLEQLELRFHAATRVAQPQPPAAFALQEKATQLLRAQGATRIADSVRVAWSARLRSAAGRANYRDLLITLNPRLHEFGDEEIDRTLRHELAHLLAHFRAGRRRIAPHGPEWRRACSDLGIHGEARCHTLPLPVQRRAARFVYRCAMCAREFPRVRRIRRSVACLACCKKHNGGRFDERAKLRLVRRTDAR